MNISRFPLMKILLAVFTILVTAGSALAAPPKVSGVSPNWVPSYGGITVLVDGRNFVSGARVFFGAKEAKNVSFISSTQLSAVTPLMAKGIVDVKVTNPDGKSGVRAQALELFYNGDGVFGLPGYRVPPDSDDSRNARFADVDRDGDQDVFVSNWFGQSRLYLNDGTGTYTDATTTHLPAVWTLTNDAQFGDIDGDGDLDLMLANGGWVWCGQGNAYLQNQVYLNDGTGHFTDVTATAMPTMLDSSTAVAIADMNGDGTVDYLAFSNRGWTNVPGGTAELYKNDGAGHFTRVTYTELSPAPPWVIGTGIAFADFNGDGLLDLLSTNRGYYGPTDPYGVLYLNNGAGAFVASPNLPVWDWTVSGVKVCDVNGDGVADLLINGQPSMRLYVNNGTGVFTDETAFWFPVLPEGVGVLDTFDENGDGKTDLIMLLSPDSSQILLRRDALGRFQDASTQLRGAPYTGPAVFGNANGDVQADIFQPISYDQNRLLLSNPAGYYEDVTTPPGAYPLIQTGLMVVSDFDRDGDKDLISTYSSATPLRMFLNNGAAAFSEVTGRFPTLPYFPAFMVAGDINNDSWPDLVISGQYGEFDIFLLNNGDGTFRTASSGITNNSVGDIDLGDVNGDGSLDLLLTTASGLQLYLNNGAVGFVSAPMPTITETASPALFDMDNDRDLDIVGAGSVGLYLLQNDGTGRFTDVTAAKVPTPSGTGSPGVGDLDGDGDVDVFLFYDRMYVNPGAVYLNDGTGGLTRRTDLMPTSNYLAGGCSVGDIDGDGDLDLFHGAELNYPSDGLLINDGTGHFTDESATRLPRLVYDYSYVSGMEDLDGDGDLDLFAGSSYLRIFHNEKRPDTIAPSAPTGLSATAVSASQIFLSWQPSSDNVGVVGYDIFRNSAQVGTTATTTFGDTGLLANTTYCYVVKAFDAAGNRSVASATVCATTPGVMWSHVQSISFATRLVTSTEYLDITVVIVDQANLGLSGATVRGDLELPSGTIRAYSGTTTTGGRVVFSYSRSKKPLSPGTYTFTVTGVSHATYPYDPSANLETSDTFRK